MGCWEVFFSPSIGLVGRVICLKNDKVSWDRLMLRTKSLLSFLLKLTWNCCIALFWRERNRRQFRQLERSAADIVVMIKEVVRLTAYDPLDPNGNVTIKWDIVSWTPDGYVAVVTMNNFQMYRHIMSPGWTLGWTWGKKEVICMGSRSSSCCLSFPSECWISGTSNKTVKLHKNFTLLGPGPGYTCGAAKVVPSTTFLTPDRRRKTQALMTWNVTCTYSQFLAMKNPNCCVSFSSFYNETITPCPSCACGCQNKNYCVKSDSKILKMVELNTPRKDNSPLLQCTHHMCPVRVHWHVKLNYKDYWRVKVSITNFNYRMNYTLWSLVVQHPNLNNVTQVFSFYYKPLVPCESINDTWMFYGMKYYNDLLMEAAHLEVFNQRCFLGRTRTPSLSSRGGHFPGSVFQCKMVSEFVSEAIRIPFITKFLQGTKLIDVYAYRNNNAIAAKRDSNSEQTMCGGKLMGTGIRQQRINIRR
ncbi:COBRA-like protein 6 [Hibiscus syriacus]|uniref:COBRA-like protein 6 n=1 Tax=Hibiscus syriacus TaxID=106335 RepID=A0A6A3C5J4_HIBSY|nr:COBRA-like protein 6 [Hibiscus syriacus]